MSRSDAVLDNWQSEIKIDAKLVNRLMYSVSRIRPIAPGDVVEGWGRTGQWQGHPFRRTITACQKISWHSDPILTAWILVLRNDAHVVEGNPRHTPTHQSVGSILVMNLAKQHRCKCLSPRSKGKRWVGLVLDFARARPRCDRATIEAVLTEELHQLWREQAPLTPTQRQEVSRCHAACGELHPPPRVQADIDRFVEAWRFTLRMRAAAGEISTDELGEQLLPLEALEKSAL